MSPLEDGTSSNTAPSPRPGAGAVLTSRRSWSRAHADVHVERTTTADGPHLFFGLVDIQDVIATAFSLVALAFSLWSFRVGAQRDRRDLFLTLHERLIDPELQAGRKALHQRVGSVEDAQRLETADPQTYALVGRALAMFDIFGLYAREGYIDKQLALREWGRSYSLAYQRSRPYLEYRAKDAGGQIWPNLRAFGEECAVWVAQEDSRRGVPVQGAGD